MNEPMEGGRRGRGALTRLGFALSPSDETTEVASPERAEQELGARVSDARKRAHLSGVQLGLRVGLSPDQVSKIEHGRRRLSPREVPIFATALGVTNRWLLGVGETPRMALAHRLSQDGSPGMSSPQDLPATQRRALEILRIEQMLETRVELPPARLSHEGAQVRRHVESEMRNRPRNKAQAQRQGRQLAERVRRELDLGRAEIRDVVALIETHFGVDVVLSPLGQSADGLCAHTPDQALIVASSDFPDGHVRFTLAHELGHHLLDDPREVIAESDEQMCSEDIIERRVHAFAAHLLLPESGVREALSSLNVTQEDLRRGDNRAQRALGTLMHRFGVSLQALLFQLADLDVLSFADVSDLRSRLRAGQVTTAHHRPTAAIPDLAAPLADQVSGVVRPPSRLLEAALSAARAEKIGTSVIAALLERDDDEALFDEIMGEGISNSDLSDAPSSRAASAKERR